MDFENADVDIPLVDEINELLHKERTLMSLKVIEQQVEAEEWKKKYETLVQHIGPDGSVGGGQLQAYEFAADVASRGDEKWQKDVDRILQLQHESDYPWCLDISHVELQSPQIKKILNFPKSHNFHGVRVITLRHCGIKDTDAELVSTLLHFPGLQALDLSHNELGNDFQKILLSEVERRRLKLQYLLLEGNMTLSHCNLENVVHHLTGHTWGLSVTLVDMGRGRAKEGGHGKSLTSTHRLSHAHAAAGGKHKTGSGDNPHLALRFLRNLNFVLDRPADAVGRHSTKKTSHSGTYRQSSGTVSKMKSLERASSGGRADARQDNAMIDPSLLHRPQGGPQLLAVLGLTHAWLCKESILQLQRTLEVTIASLTDLDLTHSLIGYKGALVMGSVLAREACQLVRLNLTGNGIGDQGLIDGIMTPLKASHTLTYLNLQSNSLTDIGLRALGVGLARKQTLSRLLIDGNHFTPDTAIFAQRSLLRSGAQVHLVWGLASSRLGISTAADDKREDMTRALPLHSHLNSLYTIMGQISVAVDPMTRSAHLYTIHAHCLRPQSLQYSSGTTTTTQSRLGLGHDPDSRDTVVIRWEMGINSCGTLGKRDHMRCRLAYEVRQVSGSRSTIACRKVLLSNACLPIGSKTRCSATVTTPAAISSFEVWAVVVGSDGPIGLAGDGNGLHIECSSMEVSRALVGVDPDVGSEDREAPLSRGDMVRHVMTGGDAPCWSAAMNAVASTPGFMVSHDSSLLSLDVNSASRADLANDFSIVRKLRWIGQPLTQATVQFQIRLCTVSTGVASPGAAGGDVGSGEREVASKFGHLGYEWRVLRCRHDCGVAGQGQYSVVANGELNTWTTPSDPAAQPSANQLLAPWLWQDVSATVENVAMNDGFLICCKVTEGIEEEKKSAPPYTVGVKNVKVCTDVELFAGWEDLLNEGDYAPTVMYSTFNNSSLEMIR